MTILAMHAVYHGTMVSMLAVMSKGMGMWWGVVTHVALHAHNRSGYHLLRVWWHTLRWWWWRACCTPSRRSA